MHLAKFDVPRYLQVKRNRKAIKQRKHLHQVHLDALRARQYRLRKATLFGNSSIISEMLSECGGTRLNMPQTSLRLPVPRTFSMTDDPEQAIKFVASFAFTHRNQGISDVYVDFSKLQVQDLGAHALLDKLVEEINMQASVQKTKVAWKGNFPDDPGQQRFICAMGIIRELGITHRYLSARDANRIHLFERRSRHYIRNLNPFLKDEKSNAAERFVNHVNRCLHREHRELTPTARQRLCDYVAEILDNAECHPGMVDWTIQGYLDTALPEPECEIVLFNFGKSIAKTLEELPQDHYTRVQIQPYLDLHSRKGWFGRGWRREDLLTLIALQGQVSCRNVSAETTRGQGTADLIEFFQAMHDERKKNGAKPARMYIVSGATRVLFDGQYRMQVLEDGGRRIAFNPTNDLSEPPDPRAVMPLEGCHFPGTIIGIKFPIHAASLQQAESPS